MNKLGKMKKKRKKEEKKSGKCGKKWKMIKWKGKHFFKKKKKGEINRTNEKMKKKCKKKEIGKKSISKNNSRATLPGNPNSKNNYQNNNFGLDYFSVTMVNVWMCRSAKKKCRPHMSAMQQVFSSNTAHRCGGRC